MDTPVAESSPDVTRQSLPRGKIALFLLLGYWITLPSAGTLHAQLKTRTEQIEQDRRDNEARLWPERTSAMTERLNGLVERGLMDGFESGKGNNGIQAALGGMRSGNGAAFGVGYRRSDLWRDRLGFRSTVRGTLAKATFIDFELNFPKLTSDRVSLDFYAKYENSPQMDYYGQLGESAESLRSSYRLEDTLAEFRGSYRLFRKLKLRGKGGGLLVHNGRGQRDGFPCIEEVYDTSNTPGFGEKADFLRWSGGLQFDYRDNPNGPRAGGNYYADLTYYSDHSLRKHTFKRLDLGMEHYVPYFNKTRIIAIRLAAVMAFADTAKGQTIPFYLQPTLGGNRMLRGFGWYRFQNDSMVVGTVEHRWYVFSGMDAAFFLDVGKVAPNIRLLNLNDLEYSGGFGLRFKIRESVVMRIDNAVSREGYRLIWTFDNVF